MFKDDISDNLNNSSLNTNVINYLRTNLKEILTGKPKILYNHHLDLLKILFNNNLSDYEEFNKMKRKPKKVNKVVTFNKFNNEYEKLGEIFNYSKCISGKKEVSYEIASTLNINTCTYCNRLYTNTIITEKKEKVSRPDFDHWFPKKKFPILALSFYNLIPSCTVCNSKLKRDKILDYNEYLHPYINDENTEFNFSYHKKTLIDNNVKIRTTNNPKVHKTLELFKINEVYNAHSDSELRDLLDLRYKYSDNYIKILFEDTFNNIEIGKDEVYRLIFGTEPNRKDFHKKPFSKFKSDLLKELGIVL